MKGILILPIGKVDSDILKSISDIIEKTFRLKVMAGKEMSVPQDSYDSRRRQYNSTIILKEMQGSKYRSLDRKLGVTEVDLYVSELNFVFGEADVLAGAAIISLARLRREFYGLRPDKGLLHRRASKEAIHELGHVYGLDHCSNPKCIMYFSNSIKDTDRKGPAFCGICESILGL